MSSMQAGPCRRPLRKRRSSARFWRQFHWRSMSKPSLSSKLRVWILASCCCCWKASAIPRSRMAHSFSMVGCINMVYSFPERLSYSSVSKYSERRLWLGRRLDLLAVQMVLQNRLDAGVGTGMERDGAARSRLHSLAGVLLGEPQNAEAGAIALFRMALAGHDAIKQFGGCRTDRLGPVHQAGGRPLQVPLVRLGPVIMDRGRIVGHLAPRVAGHAQAAMEDLNGRGGGPHLHLLLCELIGNAVPVVVELYVIVDIDAVGFPVTILVTFGRQGAQRRLVERLKHTATRPVTFAERPVVEAH